MYTFVFIASTEDELTEVFLRSCARITKRWMPSLDVELAESYTILPECNSGWFSLAPACAGNISLISEVIEDRYAVLVFGDTMDGSSPSASQAILNAWKSSGPMGVLALEIFGRNRIESLLNEHVSKTRNHTQTLGFLITIERWRTLIQVVAQEAARTRVN